MYNPKSLKAEEFINHNEIMETLAYAEHNKDNIEQRPRTERGLTIVRHQSFWPVRIKPE